MRSLRYLPAFALLLGALMLLPPVRAQSSFRLTEPTLFVDRVQTEVDGAPLVAASFERLALAVPGQGTYLIGAEPFEGARRAGQFSGDLLSFTVEGRTVLLLNDGLMLGTAAPAPAFIRFTPAADSGATGRARVALPSDERAVLPTQAFPAPLPGSEAPPTGEASSTANAALIAEIGTLQRRIGQYEAEAGPLEAERRRLAQEVGRLEIERTHAASQRAHLAAARNRVQAQLDTLQRDIDTYSEEVRRYEAERDRLATEREQLASSLTAARQESEGLADAVARLEGQHARLDAEHARLTAEQRRLPGDSQTLEEAVRALEAETQRLVAERDRLLHERDSLRDAQASLTQEVRVLQTAVEALAAEAQRREQEHAEALSARLAAEHEPRAHTAERHASEPLASAGAGGVTSTVPPSSPPAPAPAGLVVTLPGFDFNRLQNADEVRGLLAHTAYAAAVLESGAEERVLVLFAANEAGEVIETDVEEPMESTLDDLAVALVRRMVFAPPEVNEQPAALYAQVVVRFTR